MLLPGSGGGPGPWLAGEQGGGASTWCIWANASLQEMLQFWVRFWPAETPWYCDQVTLVPTSTTGMSSESFTHLICSLQGEGVIQWAGCGLGCTWGHRERTGSP